MKVSLITALFLALFIIPNTSLAGFDQTTQINKTIVRIQANGADTEWIPAGDKVEAEALAEFVKAYNEIAYRDNLSVLEKENALLAAAQKAFDQRSTTFKGLYCVKFSSVNGSENPELRMLLYPQTNFGYRFEISFTPQA